MKYRAKFDMPGGFAKGQVYATDKFGQFFSPLLAGRISLNDFPECFESIPETKKILVSPVLYLANGWWEGKLCKTFEDARKSYPKLKFIWPARDQNGRDIWFQVDE